ncbi:NADP-dependent malic enzyme-like [Ochlerotatus camptorhynchus]|uniref:NADP-dependent malic enzyme-like n=1 Tax=Ochlerotatus camptorhynchus TaxID=644619 RepID=UPI0031DF4243
MPFGMLLSRSSRRISTLFAQKTRIPFQSTHRFYYETNGSIITPSQVRGIDHLRDARLNKGLAFTLEERQSLGIHGLLPARIKTLAEQLQICRLSFSGYQDDLNKYVYMVELHDRNEKLFYRLLTEDIEEMMPIVYTPTVGLACQKFGLIFRRARGLFVTINDRGHVYEVLRNWPEPDVRAIVVTDGERILGLGDLGACGMGIPVGKLALYTALAGVQPHQCLPVMIDVGTNNEEFLNDPLYIGLRQRRVRGEEYDELIDEFMAAVVKRYGQNTLVQFEDFGNKNAFKFLDKYRDMYCTFNDDIQGTASIVVAGLMAAQKVVQKKISEHRFLFFGAGEAAVGIADLLVQAMEDEGISSEEARDRMWMFDKHGLLVKSRPEADLEGHKACYARDHCPTDNFVEVVKEVKPSTLIGASAAVGAFNQEVLRCMAETNDHPIIFALSNPTTVAECTAQQAYDHTEGRCLFASGSPFPAVQFHGKTFFTGQGNNAYIFPGVALGVIASGIHHISDDIFLAAAKVVAGKVSDEDLSKGLLYPPLSSIKQCSMDIALEVIEYAYKKGIASRYPEPKDKLAFVKSHQYSFCYERSLPATWPWPKEHCKPLVTICDSCSNDS